MNPGTAGTVGNAKAVLQALAGGVIIGARWGKSPYLRCALLHHAPVPVAPAGVVTQARC